MPTSLLVARVRRPSIKELPHMYYLGGGIFFVLAIMVVVLGARQFNRPKCPSCGLSVDRDLKTCPYCHHSMRA